MRREYPRPQFVREDWLSLGGLWEFRLEGEPLREIQVPFVYQSALSGIGDSRACEQVYYRRRFRVPAGWQGRQVLLHFGAVDYSCRVFLNGQLCKEHTGGHTPFSADITRFLTQGEQTVEVEVSDPPQDEGIARGKQSWEQDPRFIWYTGSTGIWQPVWLEAVDAAHIETVRFTPDIDTGTVALALRLSPGCPLPCRCAVRIALGDEVFFDGEIALPHREGRLTVDLFGNRLLRGSFHFDGLCWSPESPTLFDVRLTLRVGDAVRDRVDSYFGMRKIHIENGRLLLNNKPYYQKLVLDQGYWPDGLLTAPSDEAFRQDILLARAMGFNGCRKHEKAEDPRFLYWADRLGFLVWGAMASFISYTPRAAGQFTREWIELLERDYNHPCIVVWGMLNESWGVPDIRRDPQQQSFCQSLVHLAKALDPTRPVVSNDGWEQTGGDLCALHSYRHGEQSDPAQQARFAAALAGWEALEHGHALSRPPYAQGFAYAGQPVLLTECGGISCGSEGNGWGYTTSANQAEFLQAYRRLIGAIADSDLLCGFCYTQLTDVQQEQNGLLTADRQPKFDPAAIREINAACGLDPSL